VPEVLKPKRVTPVAFTFILENDKLLRAANPAAKCTENRRASSLKWYTLTDVQKVPFIKMHELDKARHARETA